MTDTYFAVPDPLDLHLYVCLAILANCKDALEELDQSEAKSMLFNLPPLDIDRVGGLFVAVVPLTKPIPPDHQRGHQYAPLASPIRVASHQ